MAITIIFAPPRTGKTSFMTHLLNTYAFDRNRTKKMISEIQRKNRNGFNLSIPKHTVSANYDITFRKFGYSPRHNRRINPYRLGFCNDFVETHFNYPFEVIGITEAQKYLNSRMSLYFPEWQSRWKCLNALHSHTEHETVAFTNLIEGKEYILYIPEFNVMHTADNRPSISINLQKDGNIVTYSNAISFCQYDINGDPVPNSFYNIIRNHLYHFTITGISHNLTLEYDVAPWVDGGTWERGIFQYPTYHNPVIPDLPGYLENPLLPITTRPTMSYNAVDPTAGAFSVWFRMTEPVGQKWMPVVDQSDLDYEIKVYDYLQRELTSPSQWVAADTWYNIKVIPRNANKIGDVVNFGITYTQDWLPQLMSLYLFINGERNNIAWPESGDSPQKIAILQQ